MSETNGQNSMQSDGAGPTRSFDGSYAGPGAQVGPFRIERELGRGAVGVVYLAHDTKLDRSVAIKRVPAQVMADPKARSRFSREAKLLASVNHPNIATIHEVLEEAEGVGYLILEYVPGQTLSERIGRSGLKLQESLSIAGQIAEAVAAAHDHGVIHRDLKPANIKITPEGKVKVLDFGLAKVVAGEGAAQQSTVTEPGRVIGTPAYMSPEQARGRPTDRRSDIWSFGCVLYEMLTAQVPFKGETVSDTLANILQTEPNWQALPENTPANLRTLLRRCLDKDPRRRLRDIGDAGLEITETLTDSGNAPGMIAPLPGVSDASRLRRLTATVAGAVLVAAVASMIAWTLKRPSPTPMPVSSFPIRLHQSRTPTEHNPAIAVSPDGKRLVYVGGVGASRRLFLRETGESRVLVRGASNARYAPTGHLLYAQSGTLVAAPFDIEKVQVGESRPLTDIAGLRQHHETGVAPLAFPGDGLLYYVRGGEWLARRRLVWVNRQGEEVESLPLRAQAYADPSISPDGQRIAFTKFDKGVLNIWVYDLPNGPATQLTFDNANFHAVWTPDSTRLTFASYRSGPFNLYSIPVNRSSSEQPLLVPGSDDQVGTSWSSDGKVLLFYQLNADTSWDICSISIEDVNALRSLICESGRQLNAVFSPDGNWIAYDSDQEGEDNDQLSRTGGIDFGGALENRS